MRAAADRLVLRLPPARWCKEPGTTGRLPTDHLDAGPRRLAVWANLQNRCLEGIACMRRPFAKRRDSAGALSPLSTSRWRPPPRGGVASATAGRRSMRGKLSKSWSNWRRLASSGFLRTIPVRNTWLRVRRLHRAVYWTCWEHRELYRLRRSFGPPPTAVAAVVIPTYKRPDLLREAVSSVLSQSFEDLVVIIVDDGGGQVHDLPIDKRLHIVQLSRNTGVLAVVNNIGIRMSRSRYVALLNDDNRWRPDHMERALEALESGADLIYTGMRRHRQDGSDVDELAVPFERRRLRHMFFTDSSTLVVRRVPGLHFERTPRGKHDPIKEDWEFVWRYSRRMRTRLVPFITVDYLIHDNSYLTDWSDFWRERGSTDGSE